MTEKLKEQAKKLTGLGKRPKIIIVAGLVAIAILLLSEFIPSFGCGGKPDPPGTLAVFDAESYARSLESQLTDLISSIAGAGRTKVMVTLQSGAEYIYACEEKTSSDSSESSGQANAQQSSVRSNSQNSFIIIKGANGEEALVRTELMPKIGGVVILCEGAGNPEVEQRILSAVTTVLGISGKRVCITLLKP